MTCLSVPKRSKPGAQHGKDTLGIEIGGSEVAPAGEKSACDPGVLSCGLLSGQHVGGQDNRVIHAMEKGRGTLNGSHDFLLVGAGLSEEGSDETRLIGIGRKNDRADETFKVIDRGVHRAGTLGAELEMSLKGSVESAHHHAVFQRIALGEALIRVIQCSNGFVDVEGCTHGEDAPFENLRFSLLTGFIGCSDGAGSAKGESENADGDTFGLGQDAGSMKEIFALEESKACSSLVEELAVISHVESDHMESPSSEDLRVFCDIPGCVAVKHAVDDDDDGRAGCTSRSMSREQKVVADRDFYGLECWKVLFVDRVSSCEFRILVGFSRDLTSSGEGQQQIKRAVLVAGLKGDGLKCLSGEAGSLFHCGLGTRFDEFLSFHVEETRERARETAH